MHNLPDKSSIIHLENTGCVRTLYLENSLIPEIAMQYFWTFLAILFHTYIYGQYKIEDSCGKFRLSIAVENFVSDSIGIAISDCDNPGDKMDTVLLEKGKAVITGTINRATEVILYTNIHSRLMDGPQVIRFLLEPTVITLHFNIISGTASDISIEGSCSQKEKDMWEANHSLLLETRENYWNKLVELQRQKNQHSDTVICKKLSEIQNKFDALQQVVITEILKYIRINPDSYYSAYLLNHYKRSLSVDTLRVYYTYLSAPVANSDLGEETLKELFKLTDDWAFRQKFLQPDLYKKLKEVNTVYDVSLTNTRGIETSLSDFKGYYLLIDFWANWCPPCIHNIPYLKSLSREFKSKPIKILSVSIDQAQETWKKSIQKLGYPGIHLWDRNGILRTFFKVIAVPRYILIKPDGSVANEDLPQPDDPQMKLILVKELNEKSNEKNL